MHIIPTKIIDRLKENTKKDIRYGGIIRCPRRALQCLSVRANMRTTIDNFVQQTVDAIEAGGFAAEKYTDPSGSRQFTLVPIYSMQLGHIHLDRYTMSPILRSAGIPCQANISANEFQSLLWRYINFAPIGVQARAERSRGPKIHALLRCQNCSKVWNRDQMAVKNIKYIFEYIATNNNRRPPNFERPSTTTPNIEE
jgi:hypothetical protein